MRCRPLRWLWGLLPIVAWAAIVVLGEQRNLEADLAERAGAALKEAGLEWAEPSFSGRDAVLAGKAAEDADPGRATEVLSKLWGVRVVDNRAGLIDTADVYVWGAQLRDNRVRLTGFVPNDETRRTIYGVAQATFPGREIQDQTKLARGAPPRDAWLGGVSFALKQLAQLKRGSVDLDRTALTIEGDANDSKSYQALRTALSGGLPTGVSVKEDRIRPPLVSPFTWSLAWDGRTVSVAGHMPSEKLKESFSAEVRKAFPRASLVDRTEVASGEPKDFWRTVMSLLAIVSSLEEGAVELKDAQATLSGVAPTDVAAENVRDALKTALAASGMRFGDQLKFREVLPKPVSPFVTVAEVQGSALVLTGYVPSETHRTQLLDAARAKLPNLRLQDQLALAAGAPDGWLACLDAGLASLARLKSGGLRLSDRSLVLSGVTIDEDLHAAMPANLRSSANRACETDVQLALEQLPEPNLAWRAVRSGEHLTLDGAVPSEDVKAELARLAAQLFSGVTIIDRTTVTPAQSIKWPRVAETALKVLARMRAGEAAISEQTLSLAGEVADAARATAVKDLLARGLPRGYVGRETVALKSDAMIWAEQEAKRKAEEDAKRKVEDEAKRKADEEAKRKADEEAKLKAEEEARQKAAEEAQRAAVEAARKAQDDAKRAAEADAKRKAEDEARRKAEAEAAKRKADAEALARATPQQKAEASRCTELLGSTARSGRITFAFDSAELQSESFGTLDRLVEIAKSCPEARIDISGHTDTVGSTDHNEALSMQRAEAVVEYLAAKGVDRQRLTAAGYGSAKPLVPNTTAINRAKNRRIEFEAKPR